MPLPIIPTTPTQADYWRIDLEIRKAGEERCIATDAANQARAAAEVIALAAHRAAMLAQQTRLADAQATLVAQDPAIDKGWTDADLARVFLQSLVSTWGGGTTAAELAPIAQSMVAAYRKIYPAPPVGA